MFLQGAGGFLLGVPLLPSLLGREDKALAATPQVRRFIGWPIEHCAFYENRFPATPTPMTLVSGVTRSANLPTNMAELGRTFDLAALNTLRDQIMIVQGLMANYSPDVHSISWSRSASYENWTKAELASTTIDEVMARSPAANGGNNVPIAAIRMGIGNTFAGPLSGYYQNGWVQSMPYVADPNTLFKSLFSGINQSSADNSQRLLKQKMVVDRVYADLKDLQSKTALAQSDRDRLDAHLTNLRDLETRLNARAAISCELPAGFPASNLTRDEVLTSYIDLMVAAFSCGISNIGMIAPEVGAVSGYNDMLTQAGTLDYHGSIIHAATKTAVDAHLIYDKFLMSQVASLASKLAAAKDAVGASLLDNTMIMVTNEHNIIASTEAPANYNHDVHGVYDMQVVILGGKAVLQTGKVFDHRINANRELDGGKAQDYNAFLMTIMTAMGLTYADWEKVNKDPAQSGFGFYPGDGDQYGVVKAEFNYGDKRSPMAALLKKT